MNSFESSTDGSSSSSASPELLPPEDEPPLSRADAFEQAAEVAAAAALHRPEQFERVDAQLAEELFDRFGARRAP